MDESGNKRQVWQDGFGRTIEADEPDSTGTLKVGTCYRYDLNNNLTSVSNSTQSRTFVYDLVSRLTSATTPEAGQVSFSYDSDPACPPPKSFPGQLVKRKDARGILTCFQYDQLNRLTSKTYSDGTHSVSYFYDQTTYNGLSIANGKGRRTGMSDGSGQTAWSYNSVGSIIAVERTIATQTKSMAYSYNLDGTIASITYPSGRVVNYSTSGAERSLSATDAGNGFQYAILAGYAPQGSLEAVIYGQSINFSGISESRGFNNRVQITSIQTSSTAGTALNLGFSYSPPGGNNGNISAITDNRDTGRSLPSIPYDPLNRVTQAKTQATSGADCWGQGFSPDALANLGSISVTQCTAGMLNATVNSNNQFGPITTYSYDMSGNMTADGTGFTYAFDAENLLKSAADTPLGNFTYTYDGDGLRVEKSNGSAGTLYWRSPSGEALAETDLSGNTASEYVFLAGRRISRIDGSGNVYFYNVDQVGTTRTITDYWGNICYDADFTPYGQEIVQHTNSCPQNYKFTGYERDSETGLDYAFARYYSSSLSRFLSPDPLGGFVNDPQSLNAYAYVENNPVGSTDPAGAFAVGPDYCAFSGECPCDPIEDLGCGDDLLPILPPIIGLQGGGGVGNGQNPPQNPPSPPGPPPDIPCIDPTGEPIPCPTNIDFSVSDTVTILLGGNALYTAVQVKAQPPQGKFANFVSCTGFVLGQTLPRTTAKFGTNILRSVKVGVPYGLGICALGVISEPYLAPSAPLLCTLTTGGTVASLLGASLSAFVIGGTADLLAAPAFCAANEF